ncbi:hypothetical protein BofuT4_P037600.1 [Botrytis cinerea T4]|uniref:Uncharacterized protein n=1 Tax=Botryotinia fuckeliana (strain T4) TaxID=999810 RepID=G2Y540_BOTF4|nr:hypothetical protein BofuT4_P037600.1 [Botrytis cinerea T4]
MPRFPGWYLSPQSHILILHSINRRGERHQQIKQQRKLRLRQSAKSCFNGSMRSVDSINNDGKCISIHHHRHRHHNGHLADTVLSTDQPFYPACSSFAPPTPTVIETGGKKF